jgi:hypothetical protein
LMLPAAPRARRCATRAAQPRRFAAGVGEEGKDGPASLRSRASPRGLGARSRVARAGCRRRRSNSLSSSRLTCGAWLRAAGGVGRGLRFQGAMRVAPFANLFRKGPWHTPRHGTRPE